MFQGLIKSGFGLLCLLLGGFGVAQPNDCKKVVITADPAYPPLHWYDGHSLMGASIDIATAVLRDIGVPYEVRYLGPWARALRAAELGEVDMVATLKDTPERRVYLAFPSHAAFANPVAVFVQQDSALRYTQWGDLVGKRGGITLGNKFGGGFDEFMEHKLSVESVSKPELNFKKIQAGRIDYFITGLYAGLAMLHGQHQEHAFKALRPYVTETRNYAAFVRSSPCVVHLPAFDKRLGELLRDKVPERILAESLARWRAAPQAHSPSVP